jgi:MFS family permease
VANLGAFFPLFAETNDWSNGNKLTDNDVALIMSFYSFSQVIFSVLISKIKNKLGAKNTILVGLSLVMFATFGMGLIQMVKDAEIFKFISLALRFL